MIILPAIDIKDGNCVRLFKGDFSTVEKVAADYMETAKGFEIAGASWIHMVDLDGAKEGRPMNQHIYEDVAAKTGLKVEVGGGIRNLETIDTYLKSGVERVILGSAALKNPQLVKDAVQKFGSQHIAVGIDAKNGMVATEGWLEESDTDYITPLTTLPFRTSRQGMIRFASICYTPSARAMASRRSNVPL